jgi:hypothetical protein
MSTKKYYCDCFERCKGGKFVGRSTFYDHAPLRPALSGTQATPRPSSSIGDLPISSTSTAKTPNTRKRALDRDEVLEDDEDGSLAGQMEQDRFEKRLRAGSIAQSRSFDVMRFSSAFICKLIPYSFAVSRSGPRLGK